MYLATTYDNPSLSDCIPDENLKYYEILPEFRKWLTYFFRYNAL